MVFASNAAIDKAAATLKEICRYQRVERQVKRNSQLGVFAAGKTQGVETVPTYSPEQGMYFQTRAAPTQLAPGVEAVTPRTPEQAYRKHRSPMDSPPQSPQSGVNAFSSLPPQQVYRKTRMCKFAREGVCKRGESCAFAHTSEELQQQPDWYRTKLCDAFMRTRFCKDGEDCCYAHGKDKLRTTQVTRMWRNSDDDAPSDAHANKHLRRNPRMDDHPSMVYLAQRSPCTNLASSPNLSPQSTEYVGSSERGSSVFENDDDIIVPVPTTHECPIRMIHASFGVDVRVVKTFLQFGNMDDGPSLRRVSSCPAGSLWNRTVY